MFARLLLASLRARRSRMLLALTAVTLGVAVATALAALALQVGDDLARTLRAAGPNFLVTPAGAQMLPELPFAEAPAARAGLTLPESTLAALRDCFWRNNILEAAPELAVAARIGGARVQLTGTWFEREIATPDGPWRTGLSPLRPQWTLTGRWPRSGTREIALGTDLARRLSLAPGAVASLETDGIAAPWRVTGVVRAGGLDDRRAWIPLDAAQALAGRPGEVDRVWVSALVLSEPRAAAPDPAKDPAGYERHLCTAYPSNVARVLTERLAGADVRPMAEVVASEARIVERLHFLMLLLALAALTASTLGLLSTTTVSVVERGVELGLLRALGASGAQVSALLLGETLAVSLAGGALGWVLGCLGASAIRGSAFGRGALFPPLLLPIALAIAAAVALFGTLAPIRAAARRDPAEALHG